MQFNEVKDANGTSLQSYAELLLEKAREMDFTAVIVFGSKKHKMVHAVANTDGSPADILLRYGRALKEGMANESVTATPLVQAPGSN